MKATKPTAAELPLPADWPAQVCQALRWVMAAAHFGLVYTRSWCADSPLARVRLTGKLERAEQELAVLREVDRIKSARLARIPAHRRPHYSPQERLQILEVRAAQGWTIAETARRFDVSVETVRLWEQRLTAGDTKLFEAAPHPVNRFPDFVRMTVKRLKRLCPAMGKVKLAQVLARAGLHMAATTVGRMVREEDEPRPDPVTEETNDQPVHVITAKRPNHARHNAFYMHSALLKIQSPGVHSSTAVITSSGRMVLAFCYASARSASRLARGRPKTTRLLPGIP